MPENVNVRNFQRDKVPLPRVTVPSVDTLKENFENIALEIGSGVGFFALRFCETNPQTALLAMEHTEEKFKSFERRVKNHPPMDNLFALHVNAISAVTHSLPNDCISQIFINYPNPNPKNASLRWFRMPFFSELLRVLKNNGKIQLLTNKKEYAAEAKLYGFNFWKLKIVEDFSFDKTTFRHANPRTHFEKKYLENNEKCFEIIFQKSDV